MKTPGVSFDDVDSETFINLIPGNRQGKYLKINKYYKFKQRQQTHSYQTFQFHALYAAPEAFAALSAKFPILHSLAYCFPS